MRWGIVGAGPWAHTIHAPALSAHPEIEFVGVWARNPERAAELAGKHGVAALPTVEALAEQVDAVTFAIPPSAQAMYAAPVLDRGCHVLLEKPVSTDPALMQDLIGRAGDRRAVVFLTRLFDARHSQWLRGALGQQFTHAEVEWASGALQPGSMYVDSAWRHGTGVIWDLMPHVLSQLLPVLGEVRGASVKPWAEQAGVIVHLDHAGGATSDLRLTLNAEPAARANTVRFTGPAGERRSPTEPTDPLAAYNAALDTILHGADLNADPVRRFATLPAAAAPVQLMATLAAQAERFGSA